VAAARGKPIALSPDRLDLGVVRAGERVERTLRVLNLSNETVQVHLASSDCSCAEVAGLPVSIEPGQSAEVLVAVTVSRTAGTFRRTGRLRTSAGEASFGISAMVWGGQSPQNGQSQTEGPK
jgi:hypothetical protein